MAYLRYQRGFCPKCGSLLSDWLDANGKELKDPPYEVVPVLRPCCEMLEEAQAEEAEKKRHGYHLVFRAVPDLRPEAASQEG